jgi:hypothetical protein
VGVSVALGLMQALRNLLFQICARLITMGKNGVRTRLFRTMIVQDIAFFDGMRTGDIQQRIQQDVSTMVTALGLPQCPHSRTAVCALFS